MEPEDQSATIQASDFKLVRLNPLTLDPGQLSIMAAVSLDGLRISQFPCRLEFRGVPIEFVNDFEVKYDNDNGT